MTAADLAQELAAALSALSAADKLFLQSAGIASAVIADGLVGVARIHVSEKLYEPDADGRVAFISPVRIGDPVTGEALDPAVTIRIGELVDLVAWHPRHPHRWAVRTANAAWLGAIEPQYLDPPPVAIWRGPLAWLRAGGEGLVLLSQNRCEQYGVVSNCIGGLIAEDEDHRRDLQEILDHPWPAARVAVRGRDG